MLHGDRLSEEAGAELRCRVSAADQMATLMTVPGCPKGVEAMRGPIEESRRDSGTRDSRASPLLQPWLSLARPVRMLTALGNVACGGGLAGERARRVPCFLRFIGLFDASLLTHPGRLAAVARRGAQSRQQVFRRPRPRFWSAGGLFILLQSYSFIIHSRSSISGCWAPRRTRHAGAGGGVGATHKAGDASHSGRLAMMAASSKRPG